MQIYRIRSGKGRLIASSSREFLTYLTPGKSDPPTLNLKNYHGNSKLASNRAALTSLL